MSVHVDDLFGVGPHDNVMHVYKQLGLHLEATEGDIAKVIGIMQAQNHTAVSTSGVNSSVTDIEPLA
eukprot:302784-Amphidinium_carterae.1